MNTIDRGDQLAANNVGLRYYIQEGWQAVEY
jgi:hypothetical protein